LSLPSTATPQNFLRRNAPTLHHHSFPASRLIAELGADGLVIAHFDYRMSQLTPDAFMQTIIRKGWVQTRLSWGRISVSGKAAPGISPI